MLIVQTRKALHFTCAGEHDDCVKLLIEHGTNVNVDADIAGNRPLHLAAISNKMDCIIALLETGAKINMNNTFYRTPLSVTRSCLNILMKNIESANVDRGLIWSKILYSDIHLVNLFNIQIFIQKF
ncbi:Ankyrin repeat domain-containing protein 54 [Gigaspora margarita]|uniref:Ankyrin repeat domain-containing protein 54 n=1 Tax=Gigaspora margarita TaxID=4874 RepID=A0A8H3WXB7_GIGMA|nr:Ankyrin repeat domain-containing protein 54 [Gigaspora margarita]